MHQSIREPHRASRLFAVGIAAIVVIGVVSAPPTADLATPRYPAAPQVKTLAVDLTGFGFTAPTSAAATPRANAAGPTPENVFDAAVTIALAPLWYAAFPITLTGSIAFAWIIAFYVSGVGGFGSPVETAAVLQLGLATYLLGPVTYIQGKLSALVPTANSAPARQQSTPATNTATNSSTPTPAGDEPRATRALAGSRRTADRTPTAHRAAKNTATNSAEKKTRATAGPARSVKGKA